MIDIRTSIELAVGNYMETLTVEGALGALIGLALALTETGDEFDAWLQSLTEALFGCQLPVIRERRNRAQRGLLVYRRLRSPPSTSECEKF